MPGKRAHQMSAKSRAQQHLMGAALAIKRGEAKHSFPEAEIVASQMTLEQLERFARRPGGG